MQEGDCLCLKKVRGMGEVVEVRGDFLPAAAARAYFSAKKGLLRIF